MNNYKEVKHNYKVWYKNLQNKNKFEKQRIKFINKHINSGVQRVQIEPTNRCNYNCAMCPIDELNPNSVNKDLSFTDFKMIISKLPKSVTNICLSGLGEPFLNKNYLKMVKYANKKGYYVEVYNNGSLFDEEVLKYAGEVVFSVDSIDKELLKILRKGVKIDKLFENIKLAIKNRKKCKVNINFTVNSQNYKDIKNLYQFCDEMKIDNLYIQGMANNYTTNSKKYKIFQKHLYHNNYIDWEYIVNNYQKHYNFKLTIWYPRKMKGFCPWTFSNIYITKNCEIISCCQKVTNPLIFGSLKEKEFNTIYNSMEQFRQKHIKKEYIPMCENCPY